MACVGPRVTKTSRFNVHRTRTRLLRGTMLITTWHFDFNAPHDLILSWFLVRNLRPDTALGRAL